MPKKTHSSKERLRTHLFRRFGYELIKSQHFEEKQYSLKSHLRKVFSTLNINCVIDVGANVGHYGLLLRQIGYEGHIFSFEPLQSCFEELLQVSAGDSNWQCFHHALGQVPGKAEINLADASDFSSIRDLNSFGKTQFGNRALATRVEEIDVKRLDEIYHDILATVSNPHVFLKIDTQGFDLEVFNGAERILDQLKAMQSEIAFQSIYKNAPDYLTSLALFAQKGFAVSGIYPVSRDQKKLALIEADCILINQNIHRITTD